MNELALFAGAGGGILGGKLLGWRTVCAVEIEEYPRRVLMQRQDDGILKPFPIWDDVRTFNGREWRGAVDIVTGGFPCQDISVAGGGAGIDGERSGLWSEFARIIREVRPGFVFVENSPALTSRGLDRVLGDLSEMGFDAEWGVLGADNVGAPHIRKRIWIAGWDANEINEREKRVAPQGADTNTSRDGEVSDANSPGCKQQRRPKSEQAEHTSIECGGWWEAEPDVGRVVNGMARRVDQLKAIGNGQVPAVAALAWRLLSGGR